MRLATRPPLAGTPSPAGPRVPCAALLAPAAAVLLLAGAPVAPRAQSGVNIAWGECGLAGADVRTFACDVNTGSSLLVASFVAPYELPSLVGMELVVDGLVVPGPVPGWWDLRAVDGCRPTAFSATTDFSGLPGACTDPWGGNAPAIASYEIGVPHPNRVRFRAAAALAAPVVVPAGLEHYAIGLRIRHDHTVGADACDGCTRSACFLVSSIRLVQPAGVGDVLLGGQFLERPIAFWQAQQAPWDCGTPARSRTWGMLKSLYR